MMKFFTLDWWMGDSEAGPRAAYAAHLASVRHLLPADLLALHERNPLHDARLRTLRLNLPAGELVLAFDADDESGGFDRRLRLTYSGVTAFRSAADPARGWAGRAGTVTSGTTRSTRRATARSSTGCCSPAVSSYRYNFGTSGGRTTTVTGRRTPERLDVWRRPRSSPATRPPPPSSG